MVKASLPVIFFNWKDSRKVRSPNWSDAYYINCFFLMSDIFLMTFFQVFGIWIRIFFPGLSRVDAAEGDANWPGNSWNRGKFPTSESTRSKPDFHQVDRTAVLQALLWDSKSSKEVAMWDGPDFLSIFFGFCSTVSKIVVKIFQVIIIYTYRYSIQCTYTFVAVLYVWKKKHPRSLQPFDAFEKIIISQLIVKKSVWCLAMGHSITPVAFACNLGP